MNELVGYLRNALSISQDLENRLVDIIKERKLVKGEMVLTDQSAKKEHIFVADGCLRSFYKTKDGKEHTIQFAIKNWWISDYITFYTDEKSVLSIESLTNSKILTIGKAEAAELYKEYPQFKTVNLQNFERRIAALQKRILSLLSLSAADKYREFVEDYTEFEKIIPNYQIASYLGITAQSLSRIRKDRAQPKGINQ